VFWTGADDQEVSSIISDDGPRAGGFGPDTPAFRGIAYMLVDTLPLWLYGNRIPNVNVILGKGEGAGITAEYPYTQFERLTGDGETLPIHDYVIDPARGYIYAEWDDRVAKYDYIDGVVLWDQKITSIWPGIEWEITTLIGR
ncbi:unnamed protein product, partial [marine sediment metagenome]